MRNGLIDSHVNRVLDAFRAAVLQNVCSGCAFGCIFALGLFAVGFVLRSLALCKGERTRCGPQNIILKATMATVIWGRILTANVVENPQGSHSIAHDP